MRNVNEYRKLSDNDCIEAAIRDCDDGFVIIPPRKSNIEPERTYWLLDRAILIPENTTVILRNCKIKLSDRCRDNFFRSANCGLGIADPAPISNIHIKGEGLCVLEGADHPRATGDGGKILSCPCPKKPEDLIKLAPWVSEEHRKSGITDFDEEHSHTYGTDAGKEGESQFGDWRDIGILFANATDCSIENLRMVRYHGWGISWEACSKGRIEKIDFEACMAGEIDGLLQNMENQDGIDLRNGCHDIIISDITGGTGDDVIALTAIADDGNKPGGSYCTTHVMHSDWSRRERDIHDIIIRNVVGYSAGHICWVVRMLPAQAKIYNVVADNIVDSSPEGYTAGGVFLLGEADGAYGKNPRGGMKNITISNCVSSCGVPVSVFGFLENAVISNVVNKNPNQPVMLVKRKEGLKNVMTYGLNTVGKDTVVETEEFI